MSENVPLNPNPIPINPDFNVPLLRGLLDDAADIAARNINCVLIGTIISFDDSNQSARIAVNFQKVLDKVPPGKQQIFNYPTLIDCPVFSLYGGQHFLTFPIQAGDNCIILFNDRDLDNWITTGSTAPPNTKRVHSLSDGIALVGIRPFTSSLDDYDTDNVKIGYSNIAALLVGALGSFLKTELATVGVDSEEQKVEISASGVTLKTAVDALFAALIGWVDTNGDTPNPATIAALVAAQAQFDAILK
jgi:hypothetical protein